MFTDSMGYQAGKGRGAEPHTGLATVQICLSSLMIYSIWPLVGVGRQSGD